MPRKSGILTKHRLPEAKRFTGNYLGSSEMLNIDREGWIPWWVGVSVTKPALPPVISREGTPELLCWLWCMETHWVQSHIPVDSHSAPSAHRPETCFLVSSISPE